MLTTYSACVLPQVFKAKRRISLPEKCSQTPHASTRNSASLISVTIPPSAVCGHCKIFEISALNSARSRTGEGAREHHKLRLSVLLHLLALQTLLRGQSPFLQRLSVALLSKESKHFTGIHDHTFPVCSASHRVVRSQKLPPKPGCSINGVFLRS